MKAPLPTILRMKSNLNSAGACGEASKTHHQKKKKKKKKLYPKPYCVFIEAYSIQPSGLQSQIPNSGCQIYRFLLYYCCTTIVRLPYEMFTFSVLLL